MGRLHRDCKGQRRTHFSHDPLLSLKFHKEREVPGYKAWQTQIQQLCRKPLLMINVVFEFFIKFLAVAKLHFRSFEHDLNLITTVNQVPRSMMKNL